MSLLQSGSKGPEVSAWQNKLIAQGYDLQADGDFGPATVAATKDFQVKHGLDADGKVGDQTRAALAPPITSKPIATPSESHIAVFAGSRIDQINAAALARAAPSLQTKVKALILAAADDGIVLQVVQGLRTFAEQDALYAQGRTRAGAIVTHARGGQSHHNFGLACDLAPVVNGQVSWNDKLFTPIGHWADLTGLSWGGKWKFRDLPHVELNGLPNTATLLGWYKHGGLAAVWSHFT